MNIDTVKRLQLELEQREKEADHHWNVKSAEIQAELDKGIETTLQSERIETMKTKRNELHTWYSGIIEKKRNALEEAKSQYAEAVEKQNAKQRVQAEKAKEQARLAFLSAGGLPEQFEAHYQAVLVATTVKKLNEQDKERPSLVRL